MDIIYQKSKSEKNVKSILEIRLGFTPDQIGQYSFLSADSQTMETFLPILS